MRAKVEFGLCSGCGPCEEICPQVFRIEEGLSVVLVAQVPKSTEPACRRAAHKCPTGAISIED